MRFLELKESSNKERDEFENNIDQRQLHDTRRPRLTLQHLNRLRKIRESKKSEIEKRNKTLAIIYQRPQQPM
jgi:hypothetical protein